MKKILIVFGTRPEAIKMAPLIQRLKKYNSKFRPVVCVPAQHRNMLDQVLDIFNISPDYDLDIMEKDQDLFHITIRSLFGLKDILMAERPDLVMVQGDASTAFVAGLAAYYLRIPIAHVEAGLRTYNKYSPFPEEKNRHLLSVLADLHFAPTEWAKTNLIKEGIPEDMIWVTGNTVIDALFQVLKGQSLKTKQKAIKEYFRKRWDLILPFDLKKLILVTGHRRESFGEGFRNICMALKEIARLKDEVVIIYPVHLNPNVSRPVKAILKGISNIHLIEPIEYEFFVFLMSHSYLILTDSGGIQEEAPSLGKPVLVMRDRTERPEGIKAGSVRLVGTSKETIVEHTLELLDNEQLYRKMSSVTNPYGDGRASEKIVNILLSYYNL
jgi:UDP-N-acetylglucosamine 2-epimerase (non-hydrolysing)